MSAYFTTGVVAWSDTDASGRYHYTAAYRWAENAEHELYRSVIPDVDLSRFPRRMTSASYEKPLAAGDEYTVELDVEHIGNSSITFVWAIIGTAGVCVRGRHTATHVDATAQPSQIPDELREWAQVLTTETPPSSGESSGTGRHASHLVDDNAGRIR